ncbi:hypothetical protein LB505_007944 [Fusarium chuoi]|nr:hypothetical protein LB505_007944 [Fusarium chuoi]
MATTLLKKASQQFVRLSSCDSKNIFEASPGSELNVTDGSEAQTSRKFRTGGPKRWAPFRGAFKNMRKNARSRAEICPKTGTWNEKSRCKGSSNTKVGVASHGYGIKLDFGNPKLAKTSTKLFTAGQSYSFQWINHSALF